MNAEARALLADRLLTAGFEVDEISAAGGGIWCFGSRASGCARPDSDWDVLIVRPSSRELPRIRAAVLDVVQVGIDELDAWSSTELASHVARYGVRIDDGAAIKLRGIPHAAAAHKRGLVASRARYLECAWAALRPVQRDYRALRLRRDMQRAVLLASGIAVPPTAWLDAEWNAATPTTRCSVLGRMPRKLAHAIAALDEDEGRGRGRDAQCSQQCVEDGTEEAGVALGVVVEVGGGPRPSAARATAPAAQPKRARLPRRGRPSRA